MRMSREQSRLAWLAAVATAVTAMVVASVMFLFVTPGTAGPDDRGKHRGYGTHSATPTGPGGHSPSTAPTAPSTAPSAAPSEWPSDGPTDSSTPTTGVSGAHHDDDDDDDDGGDDNGGDDGGDHNGGGGGDDELPRTGTSGPSTSTLVLTGLTVLLLGAGALWLAAALSRRLEGTRLKAQAAGAVAGLRRRPSPRPRD
ncbi:hypothetical protein AB0B66_14495 [Catellatospora sp. NPDC049111]|uniref:hypothetical protein n=1 Tax=Catellatospora sp. NPDC049111 TaxID=3155271 RepID=UPI0034003890